MKMRSYMKKKEERAEFEAQTERMPQIGRILCSMGNKKLLGGLIVSAICLPIVFVCFAHGGLKSVSLSDEGSVSLSTSPLAVTSTKKGVITIPEGTVKANPFVPYRDIGNSAPVVDVPAFNLVEPPEVVNENSDAARVMDTVVSGILYDKFSPSAILNIEGNDYLVRKGDVVNNYKVLNIMKDSVTVKLGANVYKAGIGEMLTEGTLNHNDVANLNNKFGGVK